MAVDITVQPSTVSPLSLLNQQQLLQELVILNKAKLFAFCETFKSMDPSIAVTLGANWGQLQ